MSLLEDGNKNLSHQVGQSADSTWPRFHATVTEKSIGITFTTILMLLTILINSLVIITIIKRKPLLNTSYVFILNLCAANCLVGLFSMPWWIMLELYAVQDLVLMLGYSMHFFTFVDISVGVASIVSLTAISVVRWFAVSHPFDWMNILRSSCCLLIVCCLWLYGIIVASMKFVDWPQYHNYSVFVFVVGFMVPFTILVFAYGRMFFLAKYLKTSPAGRWKTEYNKEREKIEMLRSLEWKTRFQRNFRGSRTVALVTGTFLLSWLPFFAISVCFVFTKNMSFNVALAAKWLGYTNAPVSPIVYTILDKRLKRAVVKSILSLKQTSFHPVWTRVNSKSN